MKSETNTGGNFDWIAPLYDALAFVVFGRKLRQAQVVFLNQIPVDSTVLIMGGGTGWLLQQVLIQCQPKRVVYIEASARMVARACKRIIRADETGSVTFRVGDEHSLTNEQFDVILTPFVLDVFNQETLRTQFIPRLKAALKPGGLWLVTDFVNTSTAWQRALLWTMIRFFRLTTGMQAQRLANWQQLLAEAGLIRRKQQTQVGGMVSAEVWQVS